MAENESPSVGDLASSAPVAFDANELSLEMWPDRPTRAEQEGRCVTGQLLRSKPNSESA